MFNSTRHRAWRCRNSPTVDAKRKTVYFGTGDSPAHRAGAGDVPDSILSRSISIPGAVRWSFQAEPNDATLGGCGAKKTDACPEHPGPDWDFGASPILKTLPSGRDILLAPNKSGVVFALDPDHQGKRHLEGGSLGKQKEQAGDQSGVGRLNGSAEFLSWGW